MPTGDRGTWSRSVALSRRRTFRIDSAAREICDLNLKDYHQERMAHADEEPAPPWRFHTNGIFAPAGLSVTAAATALGVSRPALSSLLNGKADLSGTWLYALKRLSA